MSIEATIMVECRIIDSERTEAHLLRAGQPVLFGGRVHHVQDATFIDDGVKVHLKHYDREGVPDTQTIIVARDFQFECLAIVPLLVQQKAKSNANV